MMHGRCNTKHHHCSHDPIFVVWEIGLNSHCIVIHYYTILFVMQTVFQSSKVLLLNQCSRSNHLADLDGRSRRSNYVIMKLVYPDFFQKNKNFLILSFDIHHFQILKILTHTFDNIRREKLNF